jgi:Mor family transcriptional regulator
LYFGQPLSAFLISGETPKQTERNEEIRARYAAGESAADLAKEYRISVQRIHQILKGARK